MKVLGIETATPLCGVGLVGDDGFIADSRLLRGYAHAERLPGAVKNLMADADVTWKDLDGVAVSIGPGSFTGLRIGLSFAKALAFAHDLKLLAVPTMDALVSTVPPLCPTVCCMLVARKTEVFRQLFRWSGSGWKAESEIEGVLTSDLMNGLPEGDLLFAGPGTLAHREQLHARPASRFVETIHDYPTGYGVARLGLDMLRSGRIADPDTLVPDYQKRFQGVA